MIFTFQMCGNVIYRPASIWVTFNKTETVKDLEKIETMKILDDDFILEFTSANVNRFENDMCSCKTLALLVHSSSLRKELFECVSQLEGTITK